MPSSYSVFNADPHEKRARLQSIWRNNLPIEGAIEEKYEWFYRQAPDRPEAIFLLSHESDAGCVEVGSAGYGIRRFFADGQKHRGALMTDLAVDRAHRTLMPALLLARHSHSHAVENHSFSYGFPNKLAVGVLLRAGYKKLGQLTRYACVLRYEGYLSRYLPSPLARLLSLAPNAARISLLAAKALPALRGYRLRMNQQVDASFDTLFQQAEKAYPWIAWRGAEFINWRFCRHPDHTYEIVCLEKSQTLRAWAVIRTQGPTVTISDVFGYPDELGNLLDLLLPVLAFRGQKTVSFKYLGSQQVLDQFQRRGFVARDKDQVAIFSAGQDCPAGIGEDPNAWHLTDADEDT